MIFILGFIVGLLFAILVLLALIYFKRPIETKLQVIEKQVALKGPRPKGFIIEPQTEAERVREAIIERNRRVGRDTPISELR